MSDTLDLSPLWGIFWSFLYMVVFSCSGVVFMILVERGYLDRFATIKKLKQLCQVVGGFIQVLATNQNTNNKVNVSLGNSGKSMSCTYTNNGKLCIVNFPYDQNKEDDMKQWELFAIMPDGKIINITQSPGIPYMCSADSLGAARLTAKHKMTDEIINFTGRVTPMYIAIEAIDN